MSGFFSNSDLFSGMFGYSDGLRRRDPAAARRVDALLDDALSKAMASDMFLPLQPAESRRTLAIITTDPRRPRNLDTITECLESSMGHVNIVVDGRADIWRFTKVNQVISREQNAGSSFDWIMVIDDDVGLERDFIDNFLNAAEAAQLVIAQPAHRIHSYSSYKVTQRIPRSLVRQTNFVEIGPIVAFRKEVIPALAPFPDVRFGWGIDFIWADVAQRRSWRIGIVDASPIEHLRPIGGTHSFAEAMQEGRTLLARYGPTITREHMLAPGQIIIGW